MSADLGIDGVPRARVRSGQCGNPAGSVTCHHVQSRTCALDGCSADLSRRRANVRYCSDRHRLAAFKQRRRDGAEPVAVRPPERFPFSPRLVAPESVVAGLASWLEELPDSVGDHYDPEAVFEALLGLQDDLEEITDRYSAAVATVVYGGDDESGGGS